MIYLNDPATSHVLLGHLSNNPNPNSRYRSAI